MLFEIENRREGKKTHCGVIEFIADEGMVYLPYWMMQNLLLAEGSIVTLRNISLPKGKYVKLQPHTKDFLDISDHKAVLERSLRNYSCLTVGDTILIHYNNKRFHIDIMDAKPKSAICVIETDCEVDFAPPLDYVEPVRPAPAAPAIAGPSGGAPSFMTKKPATGAEAAPPAPEEPPKPSFTAFTGAFVLCVGAAEISLSLSPSVAQPLRSNALLNLACMWIGSGRRLDGKPGPVASGGPSASPSAGVSGGGAPAAPTAQQAPEGGAAAKAGKLVFGTR